MPNRRTSEVALCPCGVGNEILAQGIPARRQAAQAAIIPSATRCRLQLGATTSSRVSCRNVMLAGADPFAKACTSFGSRNVSFRMPPTYPGSRLSRVASIRTLSLGSLHSSSHQARPRAMAERMLGVRSPGCIAAVAGNEPASSTAALHLCGDRDVEGPSVLDRG